METTLPEEEDNSQTGRAHTPYCNTQKAHLGDPSQQPGQEALDLLCNTGQTLEKAQQLCYGAAMRVLPFPEGTTTHQSPLIHMPSPRGRVTAEHRNLITCHNGPQEQEGTKKEVSCLCPIVIHDLPLADGEGNTEDLQAKAGSSCSVIMKQPEQLPSFISVSEHRGQTSCWPA